MQVKTSSGIDLDTVVLVDANGAPYTAGGGGGSGGQVTGNVANAATDTGNPVKIGGVATNAAPTNVNNGARVDLWMSIKGAPVIAGIPLNGGDAVPNVLTNFSDLNGNGRLSAFAGHNWNGVAWDRQRGDTTGTFVVNKPVTTGGTSTFRIVSAASTNAGFVKAAPGQIYGIQLSNSSASWRFVKLYNKTTAPTLATDVPVDIVGIPPGGRVEMNRHMGMPFSIGIAIAITGAYADTDTTASAVGEVVGSIQYF